MLEELFPPHCVSDNELEYPATLLLETERTPATRITGYFENVVPNLSDSKLIFFFEIMRRNMFVGDYLQIIMMPSFSTVSTELRAG